MNNLKSQQQNPMKAAYRFLGTLVVILASLSALTIGIKSNVSSATVTAFVDSVSGFVTAKPEGGQSTRILRHTNVQSNNIIHVPATKPGTDEHWVHLLMAGKKPLVQAGTDSSGTEYRFPCGYVRGSMVVGFKRGGSNGCVQITASSPQWKSSINKTSIAQKSMPHKGSKDSFIAQSALSQLTVTPSNGLNLIYIHQVSGGTVVDVLVGSVTIKSPAGSTIVNGGIRYTDAADGRRGRTSPIPKEVYSSRPVQIFLDPNHWSEDIRFQIREFQAAVALQESRPIEFPDPTVTIGNPNSSSGVRPGRTPIQPRSQPSTQPSNPPSTRPTSSPQPSAPVQ